MKEDNEEFEEVEDNYLDNDNGQNKNDLSEKLHITRTNSEKEMKKKEEGKQLEDLEKLEIADERQHLLDIFDDLKDNIEEKNEESLEEIYKEILEDKEKKNKKVKKNINSVLLCFMYYFIAPLFSIFNLVGIFQIISIMKIVFLIFKNAFKFYYQFHFKDKTDEFVYDQTVNFKKIFYHNSYNEIVDFNLVMISAFIGNILLKSCGFYITSIIFLFINLAGILIIFGSEFLNNEKIFENEKGEIIPDFSIFQILILLLCLLILYIGAGGSALLSQLILNDGFSKIKTHLLKKRLKQIQLAVYRIRKYYNKNKNDINNTESEENNTEEKKQIKVRRMMKALMNMKNKL